MHIRNVISDSGCMADVSALAGSNIRPHGNSTGLPYPSALGKQILSKKKGLPTRSDLKVSQVTPQLSWTTHRYLRIEDEYQVSTIIIYTARYQTLNYLK